MKFRLLPVVFLLAATYILFNRAQWQREPLISWDAGGYYVFLPSVFIYHDLATLDSSDATRFRYAQDVPDYGITRDTTTGRRYNKYPLGTALQEAPLFCLTHYLIVPLTTYPADGYSLPYQISMALSTFLAVAAGLYFLGLLLRRRYSNAVVLTVLAVLAFGTNIYQYSVFVPGWSHPYSFFLCCCLLERTDAWRRGANRALPVVGLLLGLLLITRPTNILACLVPLLWPSMPGREPVLQKNTIRYWLYAALLLAVPVLLQLSYWKYISGHWLFYSYTDEGFNFLRPHLLGGLFGYRRGWFVYTPAAFIMVAGLVPLWQRQRRVAILCSVLLLVYVYVVFSWRVWHYGGGFTSRPMVDVLPVLSLPLAAATNWAITGRRRLWQLLAGVLLAGIVVLNMFQSYQYSIGVMHFNNMSRAYYWRVFGHVTATDEDRRYLLTPEEAPYMSPEDNEARTPKK